MDKKDFDIQAQEITHTVETQEKKLERLLKEIKKDLLLYMGIFMVAGILIQTLILNHFISKIPSGEAGTTSIVLKENDHIYGNKDAPIVIV